MQVPPVIVLSIKHQSQMLEWPVQGQGMFIQMYSRWVI